MTAHNFTCPHCGAPSISGANEHRQRKSIAELLDYLDTELRKIQSMNCRSGMMSLQLVMLFTSVADRLRGIRGPVDDGDR